VNPNNVFVSNAHGSHPVVKLGDLGNCPSSVTDNEIKWRTNSYLVTVVVKRETRKRFQGFYVRAPEVWRGIGLFPSSDVWSLGVTVCLIVKNPCIYWLTFEPDGALDGL
jgi:serine/threonine protein kinase